MVWGFLEYSSYRSDVNVPLGFSKIEIKKIEVFLKLIEENNIQINLKNKNTDKYFEILNKHQKILNVLKELNRPKGLYYYFPSNVMPSISKHLENEKNWEKLLELENHKDIINQLSDVYKKSTLRRIELAKKNLTQNL